MRDSPDVPLADSHFPAEIVSTYSHQADLKYPRALRFPPESFALWFS